MADEKQQWTNTTRDSQAAALRTAAGERLLLDAVFGPCSARSSSDTTAVTRGRICDVATFYTLKCGAMVLHSTPRSEATIGQFRIITVFVVKGSLNLIQWNTKFFASAGDIIVMPDWIKFEITTSDSLELTVMAVPGWWGMRELVHSPMSLIALKIPSHFLSASALTQMATGMRLSLDPGGQEAVWLRVFAATLKETLRHFAIGKELYPAMADRVGRLVTLISLRMGEEGFSPQGAADALKCSVRTIHKTCSDHGQTFNNLLMEMRMGWAAYKLTHEQDRISDVAYSCGFGSLSHFCRLFKLRFGVAAKTYRANSI
jgi:AraC-like DNA-binding protein